MLHKQQRYPTHTSRYKPKTRLCNRTYGLALCSITVLKNHLPRLLVFFFHSYATGLYYRQIYGIMGIKYNTMSQLVALY